MNLEKFTQVIEAYGSRPSNWPDPVKKACMSFLNAHASAQNLLEQHQRLESMLDEITAPSFPGLQSKVLSQQLPQQPVSALDSVINWLLPTNLGLQLWRPVAAACLPLVFGIMVGNYFSFGVNNESVALESWDDELVLLSFNDLSSAAIEPEL
jgi:hypothetical protein